MRKKATWILAAILILLTVILVVKTQRQLTGKNIGSAIAKTATSKKTTKQTKKNKKQSQQKSARKVTATKKTSEPNVMRTPIDWQAPSETVAYPNVADYPEMWIKVSIVKQRVYLMNNHQVLYTMYASTGINNRTPRGTYYIQSERGEHFYSASVGEGANYYVSWLYHGLYLFHSVPTDAQGNYLPDVAKNLGIKPSSHGCIHLSVADSKWFYENIRYGTKVVIS
jgi:lipoprotein-anchoring transpeptidase ErfK/SrfK